MHSELNLSEIIQTSQAQEYDNPITEVLKNKSMFAMGVMLAAIQARREQSHE